MYSKLPNLVIGFHGCDKTTADNVIIRNESMHESKNDYDWLGNGIYFWEQNLERAWDWAHEQSTNPTSLIKEPAVIGAVIDLGHCLNLCDMHYIDVIKNQYILFEKQSRFSGTPLPKNGNAKDSSDLLLRRLDCAVIENLHDTLKQLKEPQYDSVRGVFLEGDEIYSGSGFKNKTHIQICVRNPNCIKGLFLPRADDGKWLIP
ncbi:MAG: hypothetical protein LBM18_06110 [Oscillospiraceae bacterium]|jgi:hypothetical protein|nr:hypothetical protein [Oscillospiraceae bacterium]